MHYFGRINKVISIYNNDGYLLQETIEKIPSVDASASSYLQNVVYVDADAPEAGLSSLLTQQGTYISEDITETDGAFLCYTSGTTGLPKGALISQINMIITTIWARMKVVVH